jgi:ABC-type dipeptide/oligopeptide/nickel transport system ATPase component
VNNNETLEYPPPELLAYVLPPKEKVPPQPRDELARSPYTWDRFNAAASNDYTAGLMEALGWTITGTTRDGTVTLERPGKDEGSTSATVGAVAPGVLYVHTSSDDNFDDGRPYDAADVYAVLHHDGDRAAAERALQGSVGGERRLLSDAEVEEGMRAWRERCEAQEALSAVASVVPSVYPGVLAAESPDDAPQTPLDVLRAAALTEADLAAMPPPKWRVPGWIPEGGIVAIVGPSGAGKSFLALDLVLTLATGGKRFGRIDIEDPETVKAHYYIGEGATGYHQRIDAWRRHHGTDAPADVEYLPLAGVNIRDPQWHLAALEHALETGTKVVVIDTLAQFGGAMVENSNEDMMAFIEGVKKIRGNNNERLVVVIHHTGKDITRGSRGHSSFYAALDIEITVTHAESSNLTTQTLTKSKDSEMYLKEYWQRRVPEGANSIILEPTSGEDANEADDEREHQQDIIRSIRRVNAQEKRGALKSDITETHSFRSTHEYKSLLRTLCENEELESRGTGRGMSYWVPDLAPPLDC